MPHTYSDGVLVLSGTVHREEARVIDSLMRGVALSPMPAVVIDISGVDEVNGALLGALVRATRWIGWRNGRVEIVCARDDLRRGLEVAGLDHLAEVSAEPRARSRSGTPAPPSPAC
jgi:anti-anti-sigma regulatory factor